MMHHNPVQRGKLKAGSRGHAGQTFIYVVFQRFAQADLPLDAFFLVKMPQNQLCCARLLSARGCLGQTVDKVLQA
jgi:hypothetical protein